jgi:hypothetical protein
LIQAVQLRVLWGFLGSVLLLAAVGAVVLIGLDGTRDDEVWDGTATELGLIMLAVTLPLLAAAVGLVVLLGRRPAAGLAASLAASLSPLLASPWLSDFLWHEVMVMLWGIGSVVVLLSLAGLVLLRRYSD